MTKILPIQFCEAIEVAPDAWCIGGRKPESMLLEADIPNIVLYKIHQTLHIIDTGVSQTFREAILKKAKELLPYQTIFLHCSHFHADHIGNNSLINELNATNKTVFMSALTRANIDNIPIFLALYKEMSENFDMIEGLHFPFEPIKKFLTTHNVPIKNLADYENLMNQLKNLQLNKIINPIIYIH